MKQDEEVMSQLESSGTPASQEFADKFLDLRVTVSDQLVSSIVSYQSNQFTSED